MIRKLFIHCAWFALILAGLLFPTSSVTAQSNKSIDYTLESMGFGDETAVGPSGYIYYVFSLPTGYQINDGSYINLTFDYFISNQDNRSLGSASIELRINEQYLYTAQVSSTGSRQLRVNLPANYFRPGEDSRKNVIRIWFDDEHDCATDLQSRLIIRKSSVFHLVYEERPLPLDLALFPKPIYSGPVKFEQNQAHIVLPNAYEESDVHVATIMAARLGQVTNGQLPLTATVESKTPLSALSGTHLIAVGKLDKNPLIGNLAKPISIAERRLSLHSQMPMMVSVGSVMSYTLVVENTSTTTENLVVEDRFSPGAVFTQCDGVCKPLAPNKLRWDVGALAPGQQAATKITLELMPLLTPGFTLRHTATLIDSKGNVLNVDTLSTQIGETSDNRLLQSAQQKSNQFFIQGTEALAEDAGVLQEIILPWDAHRIGIIVTGLTDEAVLKATHGLNPQYRFPGITGPLAIVEDIRPISPTASIQANDLPLAALGYENRELDVLGLESAYYSFDLPPATSLDASSYFALHYSHAAILSKTGGSIKVSLNDTPIGSAALDDSNLNGGWLQMPLSKSAIRPGLNYIRVQTLPGRIEPCQSRRGNPYWLVNHADSFLHLEYGQAETPFDLKNFPYPYSFPGDMRNLVFALSSTPSPTEIDQLLRIAFALGSHSGSKELAPRVIFGQDSNLNSVAGSNVIAVGLAKTNPFIRSANSSLPQPFVPDTNDILQKVDRPIYNIPPGTDLGIIQQIVSPWSKGDNQAFLVASGTTDTGVGWSVNALSRTSSGLKGNLVIVRGETVYGVDTRPVDISKIFTGTVSITPMANATPIRIGAGTPTPQRTAEQIQTPIAKKDYSQSEVAAPSSPSWLVPLLIVCLTALSATLIIWIVRRVRS